MDTTAEAFLLTRDWRETPRGPGLVLWAKGAAGPIRAVLSGQEAVCFVPRPQASPPGVRRRQVALATLAGDPVDALYFRSRRDLESYRERPGVEVHESDVRPADRYLMERFITGSMVLEGPAEARERFVEFKDPRVRAGGFVPVLRTVSLDIETSGLDGGDRGTGALVDRGERMRDPDRGPEGGHGGPGGPDGRTRAAGGPRSGGARPARARARRAPGTGVGRGNGVPRRPGRRLRRGRTAPPSHRRAHPVRSTGGRTRPRSFAPSSTGSRRTIRTSSSAGTSPGSTCASSRRAAVFIASTSPSAGTVRGPASSTGRWRPPGSRGGWCSTASRDTARRSGDSRTRASGRWRASSSVATS